MTCIIQAYYEKQAKKGKRGGLNLPAMARKADFMTCIQSDVGMLFVSEDVIALEPSITAEMSGDPMYRYATLDGIGKTPYYKGDVLMIDDIYLMSASQFPPTKDKMWDIFHNHTMPTGLSFAEQWLADSEVCKDYCKKPVRNFAKTACLGIGYGMGWKKFMWECKDLGLILTPAQSRATIEAYWELFAGLKRLRDTMSWTAKKTGCVINPFGYRNTPQDNKAMNAFIQSSASGVLDIYIYKLFAMCPYLQFIALIHDEVVYSCPENMVDRLKFDSDLAVKSLNDDLGWSVPIRFGTKIATDFGGIK